MCNHFFKHALHQLSKKNGTSFADTAKQVKEV
jgi:hypothetical protein